MNQICVHSTFEAVEEPFYYVRGHIAPDAFLRELTAYLRGHPGTGFKIPHESRIIHCYLREIEGELFLVGGKEKFQRLTLSEARAAFKATIIRDW